MRWVPDLQTLRLCTFPRRPHYRLSKPIGPPHLQAENEGTGLTTHIIDRCICISLALGWSREPATPMAVGKPRMSQVSVSPRRVCSPAKLDCANALMVCSCRRCGGVDVQGAPCEIVKRDCLHAMGAKQAHVTMSWKSGTVDLDNL